MSAERWARGHTGRIVPPCHKSHSDFIAKIAEKVPHGHILETRRGRGDDPLAFVISTNLHRRHLSESQRAMVASRLAKMSVGDNQHSGGANLPNHQQAAEMLNVSPRSVKTAKKVERQGDESLVEAVEQGEARSSRKTVPTGGANSVGFRYPMAEQFARAREGMTNAQVSKHIRNPKFGASSTSSALRI